MNIQKYFSLKIHQADLAAPTHKTLCLLCGVQGDLLVPPPIEKTRMGAGGPGRYGDNCGGGTAATNDVTAADRGEEGKER